MAPVTVPPSDPVSVYTGIYMPLGLNYESSYSMSNITALKDAGVNTVVIGPVIKVNARGEARIFIPSKTYYPNQTSYTESKIAERAKQYYENGIRLYLMPDIYYENEFSDDISEPQPIPADIAQKPGFLDRYDTIVGNISIIAEKYHAEFFSPMNEPDRKLGTNPGSSWGQSILPKIRKNYHGKIVFKAAYSASMDGSVNFKGYDIIGFSTSPTKNGTQKKSLEAYAESLNKSIIDTLERAQLDGVPSVFLTEIGVWGSAQTFDAEGKVLAHKIAFEQGKGRVTGFIVVDPIRGRGQRDIMPIRDTELFDEVRYWFTKGLFKK